MCGFRGEIKTFVFNRGHSTTTWTKFWSPPPSQLDNCEHFTWYLPTLCHVIKRGLSTDPLPPLLVHVVIEWPLEQMISRAKMPLCRRWFAPYLLWNFAQLVFCSNRKWKKKILISSDGREKKSYWYLYFKFENFLAGIFLAQVFSTPGSLTQFTNPVYIIPKSSFWSITTLGSDN